MSFQTDSTGISIFPFKTTILGQVRTLRCGKKNTFMDVGYGDFQIQAVVPSDKVPTELTIQSYCEFIGKYALLPEGKTSSLPFELQVESIKVISTCSSDVEQQCPSDAGADVKLEKRHFYFRDPQFVLIMKCHAALLRSIRQHFYDTSCMEITPPVFTGVECEGVATLFKLQHPGRSIDKPMTAFLTQSSQFALEMMLPGIGDCFCIEESFRAEDSHTRRHLTEFTHAESEWGGIMKFDDHLDKLKSLMQGIVRNFLLHAEDALKKLGTYDRVIQLEEMTRDIMILEHKDAIKMCQDAGITKSDGTPFGERDDIPEAQERKLIDSIGKIVFLTKFPKEFKSFYMGLDPEDESRVLGCDIEVPTVGEIVGSGVREYDHQRLQERLMEQGLKPEDYSEYLDLRKYGFCRTSGMGLGVGRLLTWLLGTYSIRDVTAFPRFPGYLRP